MKKGILIPLVLLATLTILGFVLPRDIDMTRSITVDATPAEVHAWVGELRQWEAWTPWKDEDPTIVVTFGDKSTGVGAFQSWTGDQGDGELTFTSCDPATGVAYDLTFIQDGERMPAKGWLTYHPVEGGTRVDWRMAAEIDVPFGGGFIRLAMEPAMGGLFDRGLERLKERVEAGPPAKTGLEQVVRDAVEAKASGPDAAGG